MLKFKCRSVFCFYILCFECEQRRSRRFLIHEGNTVIEFYTAKTKDESFLCQIFSKSRIFFILDHIFFLIVKVYIPTSSHRVWTASKVVYFRVCLPGVRVPQMGEVTRLGGVTRLPI